MANSIGRDANSSSRRCRTFVSVSTPTVPRTPLPTKLAVAEKHMSSSPGWKSSYHNPSQLVTPSLTSFAKVERQTRDSRHVHPLFHQGSNLKDAAGSAIRI